MNSLTSANKIKWYASGGGIAQSGPYNSQIEAYKAYRLTDIARERQRVSTGSNSQFPVDLVIWPDT